MEMIVYIIYGIIATAPISWGIAFGYKIGFGGMKWSTVAWAPVWMYPIYIVAIAAGMYFG